MSELPLSSWVKTPVNITLIQSSTEKGLIFFNVSLNRSVWGTPVPTPERIDGSSLKEQLQPKMLSTLKDHLQQISENFLRAFQKEPAFESFRRKQHQSDQTPLEAYINLYTSPENMKGYMDGKPRQPNAVTKTFMRDLMRWGPIDGVEGLSYNEPTPWTGMIGYAIPSESEVEGKRAPSHTALGRIANGGGRSEGYSESGLFLSEEVRGQGFGRDGVVALLVHAWIFSKLGFPLEGKPVTHFTATVSPDNERTRRLIKIINDSFPTEPVTLQASEDRFQPYGAETARNFYTVNVDNIERVLGLIVSQDAITINGKTVSQFMKTEANTFHRGHHQKVQQQFSKEFYYKVALMALGVFALLGAIWLRRNDS